MRLTRVVYTLSFGAVALLMVWKICVEHVRVRLSSPLPAPALLRLQNATIIGGRCGCSGTYLSREERRELELSALETTLVALPKPKRRFHSNHWFHDGEYFLSMHAHPALRAIVANGDSIIILANEIKFVRQLTNMAAFILALALGPPDGSLKRLEVFEPAYLDIKLDDEGIKWGSFISYGAGFVFRPSPRKLSPGKSSFFTPSFGERISSSLASSRSAAAGGSGEAEESVRDGRGKTCRCGKLVDFVGRTPVSSTEWFRGGGKRDDDRDEVAGMKRKIDALCGRIAPNASKPLKMLVYQRNANRKFENLPALLLQLKRALGPSWIIESFHHSEDLQPCALRAALADSLVYLTTHGFQSTALMFLPHGSHLVEIFPYKYFKRSYTTLATQFGLLHHWTQNTAPTSWSRQVLRLVPQEWCMSSNKCRSLARGDNVAMPQSQVAFVVGVARAAAGGSGGSGGPEPMINRTLQEQIERDAPHNRGSAGWSLRTDRSYRHALALFNGIRDSTPSNPFGLN